MDEARVNELADNCVRGFCSEECKYIVDEQMFQELLQMIRPYIAGAVFKATRGSAPELVEDLCFHAFRILEKYGGRPLEQPFFSILRLRILNILTNHHRKELRKPKLVFTDTVNLFSFSSSKEEFRRMVEEMETREAVEKLISVLDEKEKVFVVCFIRNDGNLNAVSQETGFSPCYIRKVLRKLGKSKKVAEALL